MDEKEYPYLRRDPNFVTLSTIEHMSEHTVSIPKFYVMLPR